MYEGRPAYGNQIPRKNDPLIRQKNYGISSRMRGPHMEQFYLFPVEIKLLFRVKSVVWQIRYERDQASLFKLKRHLAARVFRGSDGHSAREPGKPVHVVKVAVRYYHAGNR